MKLVENLDWFSIDKTFFSKVTLYLSPKSLLRVLSYNVSVANLISKGQFFVW